MRTERERTRDPTAGMPVRPFFPPRRGGALAGRGRRRRPRSGAGRRRSPRLSVFSGAPETGALGAVALLELLARPAPARVVPADLLRGLDPALLDRHRLGNLVDLAVGGVERGLAGC